MELIIALFFISTISIQVYRLISWIFSLLFSPLGIVYRQYKNYKRSVQITKEVVKSYGFTMSQYKNLNGAFFCKEIQHKIDSQRVLEGII